MIAENNGERVRFARVARVALLCGLCASTETTWGCSEKLPVVSVNNAMKQAGSGAAEAGHAAMTTNSKAGSDADSSSAHAGNTARANGGASGDRATTTNTAGANGGQGAASAAGSGDASGGTGGSATSSSAGAMSQQPPANVVQVCVGHAGENVCDGTTLHHCGDMGSSTQHDPCTSATRCQAGISSGKCGVCEPNDYQCTDATPEACNAMGQWEMQKPCASAALCMAGMSKHSCDPGKCEAGKFDCSSGLLRKCKDDRTDWDTGTGCDAELCDMMAGKCNECKPGSTAMCSDPKTVTECSMDGKKKSTMCSGGTPDCVNGKCAQCMTDSECKAPNDCQTAKCDMGSGTCKNTLNAAHSSCKLGGRNDAVCDYLGNCLACVDDSDCHSAALQCNTLLGCVQRAALQATAGLPGAYGVTIAPGKTVTASYTAGTCDMVPAIGANFASCPLSSGPCPQTADSKAPMALTATVTGPAGGICPLFPLSGDRLTLSFTNPSSSGMTATPCTCQVTLTAS